MRRAIRQSRVDADGGVQIRIRRSHDRRHRSSRRHPSDIHPVRVDRVGGHDLPRHRGQDRGLTALPSLVSNLEPVPAPLAIGVRRLFRIQDKEPLPLGPLVHARATSKVDWILCTAMEQNDQRHRVPAIAARDVQPVRACPRRACAGPGNELPAGVRRRCGRDRDRHACIHTRVA